MLTAQDARTLSGESQETNKTLLTNLFAEIINQAHQGKTSCSYFTGGERFSEPQREALRRLGYSIFWNRLSSCYEVSWSKYRRKPFGL